MRCVPAAGGDSTRRNPSTQGERVMDSDNGKHPVGITDGLSACPIKVRKMLLP